MSKRSFNLSQNQIWMNEKAFPGEAVNTIAIRLYVAGRSADVLCDAVDQVIEACEIFGVQLIEKQSKGLFFSPSLDDRKHCTVMQRMSKAQADRLCEQAESDVLPEGDLYQATVYPIEEGGALLDFRFHHILVDGYSMCQIAQKVLDALSGHKLEKVPFQWQCTETPVDTKAQRRFWLEYFEGLQAENRIFSGEGKGLRRFCSRYVLSLNFSKQIDQYAQRHGISPASVFSGAFSLYLARAGQTADAVFLMPRLNRDTEENRRDLGCHTLVVPVRVPMDEEADFAGLCRLAQTQARKASQHKAYGFGNILKDLQESGQITQSLSQYTLNFYQPRLSAPFPFEIQLSMDGAMHNHLTANITRLKDTYEICYDGREGIYSPESVEAFHQAFMRILQQGMSSNGPVGAFSIVGEQEEHRLQHMEGKRIPISCKDTIASLFYKAAQDYADKPALFAGPVAYTFRELDQSSNRVANALLSRGIKPGEPVLFMLRRDYRLIPIMIGILKAGAAFIPVDPQYPKNRVDYILENSRASFLISSKDVTGTAGREYLEADTLLNFDDDSAPDVSIHQEQPAYCIYTSGTTGAPKGVMLSHRGLVNIAHPDNNPFNRDICRCGKGIVAIGSVCFDISLFEIFVPLLNGMFVELAPEDALIDPVKIAELLGAHGANLLHCTPSRLSAYLKEKRFAHALGQVEAILSAGEVLPGALVDELMEKYGIRVYNGYGPTETTIGATITEARDNRTIGRPIANTGVMILDQQGRLLPLGAVGEICIYGNGVGIGYRGLPEQTEKRFVTRYGKRMYCTGDLGHFQPDGRVVYKGRNDHQVKLRGLRIELPEIENQIRRFSGIDQANVLVRTLAGSQHLVCFYTVRSQEEVDVEALREHLKEHLALYMVPDVFKQLKRIPQTPGGKTDLKALEREKIEYTHIYRPPQTDLQKAICSAFSSVLHEGKIGLDDNFFEMGGDSLHIAELVCEIEERLPEASLAFEDIFQYPTPELLAQHLSIPAAAAAGNGQHNRLETLDYEGIRDLLSRNCPERTVCHRLGNILLTGVTGFLGIHILLELLKRPDVWDRIYCLIRPTERLTAEKRLRSALFYYGEEDGDGLIGKKLFAVEGDMENETVFSRPFAGSIQTVIHCAANVAHFAYDDKLERINTGGVKKLLAFCKKQGAALVQVSTISISGVSRMGVPPLTLTEQSLYIGQEIQNRYVLSKYMAEYEILQAAIKEGIPVKIMRVGNLQGRLADGEFQMNSRTNAFTRQISSYVKIGKVPRSLYEATVNFSPVDEVARMIVTLSRVQDEYTVFHVYPPQEVPYANLFSVLGAIGHPVEIVDDEEFAGVLDELGQTKKGKALLEGILLERTDLHYQENTVSADFTSKILERLGETWNPITNDYLNRYFTVLQEYQMFEEGD